MTGEEQHPAEPPSGPMASTPEGGQAARMWGAGRGERAGGRRRGGRRAEELMVPDAEFRSYYGRPILKPPVWTHDVAAYLFTGGLAAGSSMVAAGADLTGHPELRRVARLTSLGAVGASTYFLVKDLGRPERFLNMLRVAKPTSPMSMGTWILSAFGGAAGAAAAAEVVRPLAPLGRPAGLAAAAVAPALASYTAVLLGDTAVPSWHEAWPEMPFVFVGSALASGAGVGLIGAPVGQAAPARRLAVLGAGIELAAARSLLRRRGLVTEPYRTGRPHRLLQAAEAFTVAGMSGAFLGRRSRVISALAGTSLLAGSLASRFGIFEGGVESTKDPKYVVVPQRERLAARQRADGTEA